MSAKVLTKAAAKDAKIELIEGGRGTQALHDVIVAMRAAAIDAARARIEKQVHLVIAKNIRAGIWKRLRSRFAIWR